MRRWIVAALLLLCLPVVGRGQSIRYYPDSTSYTLGKTESGILYRAASANPTLLDGLVSYWPLDEISGVRYDAVGSNDLTDNNTVGYAAGMDGNAASLVAANSESLGIAGSPLTDAATDIYTVSLWVNATAHASAYRGVWNAGRSYAGIQLHRKTDDTCLYVFSTYDGAWRSADGSGYIPDSGGWVHLLLTVEPGVAITGYVNNVLLEQVALGTPVVLPATYDFQIGRNEVAGNYLDGEIDEVALWSRVLTADERTELWNAGAGKFYPFE